MTRGCKIWLWLVLIASIISTLISFTTMSYYGGSGIILVIIGILQSIGAAMLLFKQQKEGFYLICITSVLDGILTISQGNTLLGLIAPIARIFLTYYFINKGDAEKSKDTDSNFTASTSNIDYGTSDTTTASSTDSFNSTFEASNNYYGSGTTSTQNNTTNTNNATSTQKNTANKEEKFSTKQAQFFGTAKNMDVTVDLYKELEIDRAWDEKSIRNYLKQLQKMWTQRQGATNDKEQLLLIDKILKTIENGYRFLTKAIRRKQYDEALEMAYKSGKIVDAAEEKLHTLLDQAKAYYRKGNIKLATKFAEEALEGKINDVSVYDLLARCYFENNAYDKALGVIDQGISIFKTDINLHWLGARIATNGTKNFEDAQQRVNALIELNPNNAIGHSEQVYLHLRKGDEQLAFQEIDSYITAHPDDDNFKRGVAYDLDVYSNACYYYDPAENASYIADKESYQKCLNLRTKAAEIYADEHTQDQLERIRYYGQKEWNDWNLPAIKSLALYGTIFTAMGVISGSTSGGFFPIGVALYVIMGVLIYFSFRPYWQINKTHVTGQMGTTELIVNRIGDWSARAAAFMFRWIIKLVYWFLRFCLGLASGKWL